MSRLWRTWELKVLKEMVAKGHTCDEIAPHLDNRTASAVRTQRLRQKLLSRGEAARRRAPHSQPGVNDYVQQVVSDGVDANHSAKQIAHYLTGIGFPVSEYQVYRRIKRLSQGQRMAYRNAGAMRRSRGISRGHIRRKAQARQQEEAACSTSGSSSSGLI